MADWISDRLTVAVMQGILRRHVGRAEGASLGGFPVRRDGCCARAGAVLAAEEGRPGVGNSHHRQRLMCSVLGQPRHNLVVADGEAFSRSNEGHFPDPGAGDELLGDVDGDLSLGLEGVDGRAVATHDASDLVVKDVEALGEASPVSSLLQYFSPAWHPHRYVLETSNSTIQPWLLLWVGVGSQLQLVVSSTYRSTTSGRKKMGSSHAAPPSSHLTCIQSCLDMDLTLERRDRLHRQRLRAVLVGSSVALRLSHSSWRYMCSNCSLLQSPLQLI